MLFENSESLSWNICTRCTHLSSLAVLVHTYCECRTRDRPDVPVGSELTIFWCTRRGCIPIQYVALVSTISIVQLIQLLWIHPTECAVPLTRYVLSVGFLPSEVVEKRNCHHYFVGWTGFWVAVQYRECVRWSVVKLSWTCIAVYLYVHVSSVDVFQANRQLFHKVIACCSSNVTLK